VTFENPFFLILLPLSLFVFWFSGKRKKRGGVLHSALYGSLPAFSGRLFHGTAALVFMASIMAIAFSLSGPQVLKKSDKYLAKGDDYFILLDVSPSMAVTEKGRTRLEAAKEAALGIAEASGNDYPGLVLFGSEAAVVLLPTPDMAAFRERIESASVMDLGEATAMGKALGTALYYLKDSESEGKRVIIISDGGSNHGELPPLDAALMAAELDIPVSCIATGSSSGSRDVVVAPGFPADKEPVRVRGRISESYNPLILKQISEYTGGYFIENPGQLDLGILVTGLKKAEAKKETFMQKKDFSRVFFISGAIMLFISMLFKIYFLRELIP
jgi:Ca-activated chloride channel family protein